MKLSMKAQKYLIFAFVILVLLAIGITTHTKSEHFTLHNKSSTNGNSGHTHEKGGAREELGREMYPMGSSLPDCSHACGECSPCKRVMVSFKCSSESCPIVYRCMCNGKYYHVPSSN